jgi:hypothetical protein
MVAEQEVYKLLASKQTLQQQNYYCGWTEDLAKIPSSIFN